MVERARLSYCAAEVRRVDYDRFLVALFAPAAAREGLFALYAFNHEIAKVRETVSEPMLGQMRLQWWRETIAELYAGTIREHPVAAALAAVVVGAGHGGEAAGTPTRGHFERLIGAREFDLAARPPASLAELEKYCEGTSSTLLWLAAEALGACGEETKRALTPLGIAWALVGLIRAIPHHARSRRQYVPRDLAAEAGLDESALFASRADVALPRAVSRLAAAAGAQLARAHAAQDGIERAARPLMLHAALARAYLARLRRRGYEVTSGAAELSRPAKVACLWWAAWRGRF